MARGFESKSVQDQWQDAEAALELRSKEKVGRDEIERQTARASLQMSRKRVQRELEDTKSDLRREQLRAALQYLDDELLKIE